jgi:hypothetical protein
LAKKFSHSYDIGEPIMISEIYKTLNKVEGLLDVITVKIVEKSGASYSGTSYDFAANTSADNLRILAEENVVFEMKFPNTDIRGSIK